MNHPQVFTRYKLPDGADQEQYSNIPAPGRLRFDSQGKPVGIPFHECLEQFHLLPAAAAAASAAPYLFTLGTGTEVPARAVKGGARLTTQATTPTTGDNAMLIPATSSGMYCPIAAGSQPRFAARVAIGVITSIFASFGLSELLTDPDPTATAGEGALFLFDPGIVVTTGLAAAAHTNWILASKVNGADTFIDSGIPVVAGVDYELVVQVGRDFKALFYINGVLVGTGPVLTDGDVVAAFLGVETTLTDAAGQRYFDARHVSVARLIG